MELVIPETYSAIHLPLEVTELIIDEVANANDKETLRSFALVSRSFVFQCQRRLFHTIDLGDRCIPGQEYYRRLLRVLSRRPGFCDHVRDLRLVDTYVWDHQKNWKWLVTEDSVCDVLDLLPNIRSFSLKFNTGKPTWSMFKPCIRHSLSQLTKRPMLRSYSLSHIIDFPSSLLVTFSGVKHLELNDVAVDGLNSAASFDFVIALASVHRPSLESLILRAPSLEMVRQLCKVLSIYPVPTLKTLLVSLVDEQDRELMTELWTLLQWAADSLTHLEWRTSTRPRTPALRECLAWRLLYMTLTISSYRSTGTHPSGHPPQPPHHPLPRQLPLRRSPCLLRTALSPRPNILSRNWSLAAVTGRHSMRCW
ncbi:hypothetical protein B0H34DRAFT_286278 [Crassisporium funariophilum]|nr:hypothetical protein B0H34DRAFT_286278 [Crassisporium funariophilum]